MSTTFAFLAVLLILPIAIIWHLTKSRSQRIQEMRQRGWTVTRIANRYGVSRSTVRRWSAA